MANNFQQALLDELVAFFEPILHVAAAPNSIFGLLRWTGWDVKGLLGPNSGPFIQDIQDIAIAIGLIEQYATNPPETLDDFLEAIETAQKVTKAIADLPNAVTGVQPPPEWTQFPADLFETLLLLYLARRWPTVQAFLLALGIIRTRNVLQIESGGVVLRHAEERPTVDFARIGKLFTDPVKELKDLYVPMGFATQADANAAAAQLFPPIATVLSVLEVESLFGLGEKPPPVPAALQPTISNMLTSSRSFFLTDGTTARIGGTFALVGGDNGGPGFFAAPFAGLTFTHDFPGWRLAFGLDAAMDGVLITKKDVRFSGSVNANELRLRLKLSRGGPKGAAFLVGSVTGTRLEVGEVALTLDTLLRAQNQEFGFLAEVGHAAVVVKGGDGDGFLAKILPPDGLTTTFDLAFGWSNTKGVYFRGSAGIEATIPVHASILGVITVDSIYLAISLKSTGDIQVILAMTGGFALGPIAATVERMGLKANVSFPKSGGNLGPANLDKFGFKLPTGAGLRIDAGPVSGGGYIYIDEEKGQYAGVLQLKFKVVQLTALGLLNTKMPDGSTGFSLLIIITAKFPPIQLGFGFVLTGAGGLLGINRTVVLDVLRAGIKNRTLNGIMFPEDPVRNAPQIISSLSAVFPVAVGRYVFGPMIELGWGSPVLISIEIGIALELPSPIRLIIMGRLKLVLPDEKNALVKLQMDVLGIIDFGEGEASVDATIYDSRIAAFPISGDMAMRANWAASPAFLFSSGGFHPAFTPPPKFPHLDRMAIALATGDNPRIRLEAYMAVTSNTAQVGAHLDVYAAADLGFIGKFSVQAWLGFDALFQFSPFMLMADLGAGVALKRNGKDFLSVDLALHLTGPDPWHAWGTASFDLFGRHSIGFDVMIGVPPPPAPLPLADPLPDLIAAIPKTGNWGAQMPLGRAMLVSLREFKTDDVLAHPLGELTFRQRVVPLNVDISKVGNAVPSGARRFELSVSIGGTAPNPAPETLKDLFAAAQFFDMSDDEKLARPSFESFDAGLRFGAGGMVHSNAIATTTFGYETKVVDVIKQTVQSVGVYQITAELAFALAEAGAAAFTPMASAGAAKYPGKSFGIGVRGPSWTLAGRDDIGQAAGIDQELSYTEAKQKQRAYDEAHGGTRTQVVRSSEVVA